MGNSDSKGNAKIAAPNTAGVYTLICDNKIPKGYNIFIDICDDILMLNVISFQNENTYIKSINITDLKKIEIFISCKTLDDIKKTIEFLISAKAFRINENNSKINLILITMKSDRPVYTEFNLSLNNPKRKQITTLSSTNPLMESFISYDDVHWLRIIIKLYNQSKYKDTLKIIGNQEAKISYTYFKALCQFKLGDYMNSLTNFIALSYRVKFDKSTHSYIVNCRTFLKGEEYRLRNEALKEPDLQKKSELLDKAIEINPGYDVALNDKGIILLSLNKFEEAINWFSRAVYYNPKYATGYNNKGMALVNLGRYAEALECFNKSIWVDPANQDVYHSKGIALSFLKRCDEALECYNKAIEIEPRQKVLIDKGYTLLQLKKPEEAIECFNKTLELDRDDYDAHSGKGEALFYAKRFDESLESLCNAIKLNPKCDFSYRIKGTVLMCMEKYDEAIECFNKAIKINPENGMAYYYKGYTLKCKGRSDESIECFNEAKKSTPNDAIPYEKLVIDNIHSKVYSRLFLKK
jgi:tetratricopeptide (TPR) repeat protein